MWAWVAFRWILKRGEDNANFSLQSREMLVATLDAAADSHEKAPRFRNWSFL
jgi:hypothetical protein